MPQKKPRLFPLLDLPEALLAYTADKYNLYCELNGPSKDFRDFFRARFLCRVGQEPNRTHLDAVVRAYTELCRGYSRRTQTTTLTLEPGVLSLENFMQSVRLLYVPYPNALFPTADPTQSRWCVPPLPITNIDVKNFKSLDGERDESQISIEHTLALWPLVDAFRYDLMPHLVTFEWDNTPIGEDQVNLLFGAIASSSTLLKVIKLRDVHGKEGEKHGPAFDAAAASAFAVYLRTPAFRALEVLDLSHTPIKDAGVKAVLDALAAEECKIRLEQLDLSKCDTDSNFEAFKDSLKTLFEKGRFVRLTSLNFDFNMMRIPHLAILEWLEIQHFEPLLVSAPDLKSILGVQIQRQ